jgi:hypothetical protein
MFYAEQYMTVEMLSDVLSEFEWPCGYVLEDDLPDGIVVSFPKSCFIFCEGPEGSIEVRFDSADTRGQPLQIGHALLVLVPLPRSSVDPIAPGLVDTGPPFPSEGKAREGIRNACKILSAHFRGVIDGDYSWVDEYLNNEEKYHRLLME